MAHFSDTSQPLSPATLVITQRAHEQSGHGGKDGDEAWAQPQGLPLTQAGLTTGTAECPTCLLQRISPHVAPFSGLISQVPVTG